MTFSTTTRKTAILSAAMIVMASPCRRKRVWKVGWMESPTNGVGDDNNDEPVEADNNGDLVEDTSEDIQTVVHICQRRMPSRLSTTTPPGVMPSSCTKQLNLIRRSTTAATTNDNHSLLVLEGQDEPTHAPLIASHQAAGSKQPRWLRPIPTLQCAHQYHHVVG
jgi:hypothetical protein